MRITNETLTFGHNGAVRINFADASENVVFSYSDGKSFNTQVIVQPDGGEAVADIGILPVGLYFYTAECGSCREEGHFTVYERAYPLPDIDTGGIIYHVFVDRFRRGEGEVHKRSDSVYANDWYETPIEYPEKPGAFIKNNNFYGGNLYGVIEKLDYIASLGARTIYLSPVFEAYSNHKYDTADYMKTDGGLGGDEALKTLFERAREKNIRVILDGVFNHTGSDSVYFDALGTYGGGACSDENSPYREWYDFYSYPDTYDCWWGVKALPKVTACESFRSFICDSVIPKYMNMGAGGFRLDVVDELDGEFVERINDSVKKTGGYLVGEVWEDASDKIAYGKRKEYFLGKQLDGVMNYPLREGIIDFLVWKNSALLKHTLRTLVRNYPPDCLKYSMSFLGTHDTERIITVLGGEYAGDSTNEYLSTKRMTEKEYAFGKRLLRCAFAMLFSLVGIPCIYYGDEAGVQGYRDPFNRAPFPWGREDTEITAWVRTLGCLRLAGKIGGKLTLLDSDDRTLVYKSGNTLVVVNMDDTTRTFATGSNGITVSGKDVNGTVDVESFGFEIILDLTEG